MESRNLNPTELAALIRKIKFVVFDFDGVFTDNTVTVDQNGVESVVCWRSDGLGLRKLDALGIRTAILSTESNPVVGVRSKKLGIACVQGCADKRADLETLARDAQLTLDQICFVGNDINDLECLQAVGCAIVVQDAYPEVMPAAHFRTRTPGGRGAVREVCDLFEAAHAVSS